MLHFIDTETTGLDPLRHEIISIAIITEYGDGRIERWSSKIRPEHIDTASEKALKVNGYNSYEWCDAPSFFEVFNVIQQKLRKGIIVGHNVAFDIAFLRQAYIDLGEDPDDKKTGIARYKIDTITLAHEHLQPMGMWFLGLDSIRKFLGWDTEGAHTALQDAEDCRRLYWSLLRKNWAHNNAVNPDALKGMEE